MLNFRFVRRRSTSFLVKGLFCFGLFVFFIQITSSHPKGGRVDENSETVPLPVRKSRENLVHPEQKLSEVIFPSEITAKTNPLLDLKKTETVTSPATRASRKNEFYENVIVHFDLKGAPPKVPYFLDLLDLVAKSGATGVLIEWEDMFPWEGKLKMVRNTDAYSVEDIKTILTRAKSLGLDIIPLVQTFGHLEWFLKYKEFEHLRENPMYPQVLCLGDKEGVDLVKDAVRQVYEMHKEFGIPFFHIGADEAFEFGVCQKSREWMAKNGSRQHLALTHLKDMALYVKQLTADQPTTVLAWHDMLKDFESRIIKDLKLGSVIQPVVWDYSENIVTMNDWSFAVLAENFGVIWASSAYKGANFPSASYIDIRHYETNNKAWIRTKVNQQSKFQRFGGIIITGWQRYDHLAAICEILPMGTPSMVLQIQIALNGNNNKGDDALYKKAASLLGCNDYQVRGLETVGDCKFPGSEVYNAYQRDARTTMSYVDKELNSNHHIMGWLSPYSIRHNITQNWYLNSIQPFLGGLIRQLEGAETKIRTAMEPLFFPNTIDEFLYLTVGQETDKLKTMMNNLNRLKKLKTFPDRHFPIQRVQLE